VPTILSPSEAEKSLNNAGATQRVDREAENQEDSGIVEESGRAGTDGIVGDTSDSNRPYLWERLESGLRAEPLTD
jgi:hypothetical protein